VNGARAAVVAVAVLVVVAAALFVIGPWSDPNHQTAEQVVRNAGVPTGITPGAPP
jgi:hypothetical protein